MRLNGKFRQYGELVYSITSCTQDRKPFFLDHNLCTVWLETLRKCKEVKAFQLYAFCLLPDHFHLLVQPGNEDIGRIMQSLKRNSTNNINNYLFVGAISKSPLQPSPKFQWQKNYFDHVIRSTKEFHYQNNYIAYNFLNHDLPADWQYTSLQHPELLDRTT